MCGAIFDNRKVERSCSWYGPVVSDWSEVWEKAARGGGMCSPQVTRYVVKGQGSKVSEVKVTQRKVSPWDVLFFFLWSV